MKPDELLTLFGAQLEVFEPIVGQPTNGDITRLREVITSLLYPIPYDGDDQKHNLLGIIMSDAAYTARYTTTFPPPDHVNHYDSTIADDAEKGARQGRIKTQREKSRLRYVRICVPRNEQVYPCRCGGHMGS